MRHNLTVAQRHAHGRRIWAAVKANAYGHGIERVLPALTNADGLALLDLDEARRARSAGWRKPILLLEGFFSPDDLAVVHELDLTPVVHHLEQIEMLEAAPAERAMGKMSVYVKLNTGMQRLGFNASGLKVALTRLAAVPGVHIASLMTHFANSNVGAEHMASVDEQLHRFVEWTATWTGETCLANSAALLMQPQVRGEWVRPGILLYGATPASHRTAASLDLKPVMRLQSKLIAVQTLSPGDAVGYGSRWVAHQPTRIGVVACGYADGYPRIAPDGTPVWVDGHLVPVAGRVSMDMITVDLTDAPNAKVGSPVQLWGERVPIDTVAERADTVGYELMCALSPRVPVVTIA